MGVEGFQALLGHLVSTAETLREHLEAHASTTVLNHENFGPVTLFRVYPDGVDTFSMPEREMREAGLREAVLAHNEYNQRIFDLIQADALKGIGVVISLTDCYRTSPDGVPLNALKSYILSPFTDDAHVIAVLESLWKARETLRRS